MIGGHDRIRHPGPPSPRRILSARGTAHALPVTLPTGRSLMSAVAAAMDEAGCDSGVMLLDGLAIGPYRYVMPGPARDERHAAWYSDEHAGEAAVLRHATAIVGRKGGAWWLHCHAVWDEEGEVSPRAGHLLPAAVTIAREARIVLHAFEGGVFDTLHDAETNFDIFHATGGREGGNAVIAKIAPHEEICAAIATLARDAGFGRASVYGIGSLIGAVFEEGAPMASPISEVVLTPGARWQDGTATLPVYCVDPANGQFYGTLRPGSSPVCVTFEVMVVDAAE